MDNHIVINNDDMDLIAAGFQQGQKKPENCPEQNASTKPKRRKLNFAINLMNSDLNICQSMIHDQSISPLKHFLSLDDYLESIPQELKEELENLENPFLRLSYVVDLLIRFSTKNMKSKFFSVAIKLTMIALQLSKCIKSMNLLEVKEKFFRYFRLMREIKCKEELLSQVMTVLMESTVFKQYLLHFFLIHRSPGIMSFLEMTFEVENFITYKGDFMTLAEHGALSRYTENDWDTMKTVLEDHNNPSTEFETRCCIPLTSLAFKERSYTNKEWRNIVEFRSIQVVSKWCHHAVRQLAGKLAHRYEGGVPDDYDSYSTDYQLKLLWATLPNPFLTEEDFKTHKDAWLWYKEIVLDGKSYEKSPRSLQHLSRCAIRHAMAVNFQLPKGVQSLKLPNALIDFILLKDCGKKPDPCAKDEMPFSWKKGEMWFMRWRLFRICMRNL